MIDLDGRTMMPGFVSAHDHLISSNWTNAGVNLFSAETIEECLKLIKEYAEANPDHKVIKGIGWNVLNFGGVHPTAKQLDTAVPDRPAIILDFTIHDAWLNTKALNMANITKETPDAVPGVTYWVRDDQGNPTGCAIEIQWMQAYNDVGAWEPKKMMKESADKLLTIAASNGTTTFLNPGVITPNIKDVHGGMETDFMAAMEMLTEMEKKGELNLRVNALPFFKSPDGDPKKFVAFAKKMSKKYNTDKIRVQSVKIHPEGNSTSAVAPFLESYSHKDTKGAFNVKPEVTRAIFLEANKAGLDVMIHTDGDASTRAAVDAFEASVRAGYTERRNALHHLVWTHPDDYKRLVDLKIPVNATPNFSLDWTGQGKTFTEYLGLERVKTELGRYSDLVRAGNHVSIAADVPSTMPDMQGALYLIQAATTLMDPGSKDVKPFPPGRKPITVEQAIRAVTIEPAWQMHMEDRIGTIEVGKYADLVVLEKSPFDVELTDIADIDVLATMMDGKFTYISPDIDGSKDKYLSPAEYSPSASISKPEKDEILAQAAAMKFASLFCCGAGHPHTHQ